MEAEKYARGVKWVQEVLYKIQFTAERLTIVANKMMNDVARFLFLCLSIVLYL